MLANVRLVTDKDLHRGSRLYLNGSDISENVQSIHIDVGCPPCIPEVTINLLSAPFEYNGDADVKYDFTPDSVNDAIRIVKSELAKKGDAYEELIDRISQALQRACGNESCAANYANRVAGYIANALTGLED